MDDEIFSDLGFADSPSEPLLTPLSVAEPVAVLGAVLGAVPVPEAQSWTQRISQAQAVRLDTTRVLLVDDSPDNQRLFHRILAAAGATTVIAENGRRAIECFEADPSFDLIIMDIRMPIVDGYEATRQIRSRGFCGPIMALTAHANPGEEEKCRSAGCSDFQLKPIDRLSLLNAVERNLEVAKLKKFAGAHSEKSEGSAFTPTLALTTFDNSNDD